MGDNYKRFGEMKLGRPEGYQYPIGLTVSSSSNTFVWANTLTGSNVEVTASDSPATIGGTITTVGTGPTQEAVHTFTTSAEFSTIVEISSLTYLIVGGGGGGGSPQGNPVGSGHYHGGGGGAGGLVYGTGLGPIAANTPYSVVIGGGGPGNTSGTPSYFGNTASGFPGGPNTPPFSPAPLFPASISPTNAITGIGGGRGGGYGQSGFPGGSAGGAGRDGGVSGTRYPGQGNNGGTAGGGGGGATGNAPWGPLGAGGTGAQYSISGAATYYADGGGGSPTYQHNTPPGQGLTGGYGWNTNDANGSPVTRHPGLANRGGGGGSAGNTRAGGSGGSGVVILRYANKAWQNTAVWSNTRNWTNTQSFSIN